MQDEPEAVERLETTIAVDRIPRGPEAKEACGSCPNCGMNLACPPHSPWFDDYVGEAPHARVIGLRAPASAFPGGEVEDRYRAGFLVLRKRLVEELLEERTRGRIVAGSGACESCPSCTAAQGVFECRTPARRVYSLESLGVDVVALAAEALGLDLTWATDPDQGFVCAIGAVFFGDQGSEG